MCDVVSKAMSVGVSRRGVLAGVAAGGMALVGGAGPASAAVSSRAGMSDRHRTRVVLLGTAGGPAWWPDSNREGTASAVVVGDRFYLVDAGEGVGRQIRRARLGNWQNDVNGPLDLLRAVFLTHLHSDHISDLSNLFTLGLYNGLHLAELPVLLFGPGNRGALPPLFGRPPAPAVTAPDNPTPGTQQMWEALVRAFATDFNDRSFDNRKPVPDQLVRASDVVLPAWATADPNGAPHPRIDPVHVFEDDRVRVSATLVQHAPVFPALGYRFDTDDGSIVFSGDTGPSDNLVALAQGADVLVHEVIDRTWAERLFPSPRNDAQEGLLQHLVNAHTTIEEVGPLAESASVKTLVLNHLVPGNNPDNRWKRARAGFSGRLVVGQDLDSIGVGSHVLGRR